MTIFETIFWLALVSEIIIRAPINQARQKEAKRSNRISAQEKIMLGLLWLGMFAVPIVYSASTWLDFANYRLPDWAGWAGAALITGAVIVFWRAHADLGLNWSPTLEIREKHELVTRGIYGVIRHPMYASQCLWVIAQALLLQNWIAGFLNLVIFIPFYFLRVRAEERMMLDTFGEPYIEYTKRTGAIFPKIK